VEEAKLAKVPGVVEEAAESESSSSATARQDLELEELGVL